MALTGSVGEYLNAKPFLAKGFGGWESVALITSKSLKLEADGKVASSRTVPLRTMGQRYASGILQHKTLTLFLHDGNKPDPDPDLIAVPCAVNQSKTLDCLSGPWCAPPHHGPLQAREGGAVTYAAVAGTSIR